MSLEVHIDWAGETLLAGSLFPVERGPTVSFEYAVSHPSKQVAAVLHVLTREWLLRPDSFALDPTPRPCGPDRWGRLLIEREVLKHATE